MTNLNSNFVADAHFFKLIFKMVMAIGWHARGAGSIFFAGDLFFFNLLIIYNVISISFDYL